MIATPTGRRRCVYCGGTRGAGLTREHVLSKAVLHVAFGTDNRNLTRLRPGRDRWLMDAELTVRDVCGRCNADLSIYDAAGTELMQEVNRHSDASGKAIPFSPYTLGWLVKSHLNCLRCTPDQEWGRPYDITKGIYSSLLARAPAPIGLYHLYIQGYQGEHYSWDENDGRRSSYFAYDNIRVRDKSIVVSILRLKWLNTLIFIPADLDYQDFQRRCSDTRVELTRAFALNLQEIDLVEDPIVGTVAINNVVPLQYIVGLMQRLRG